MHKSQRTLLERINPRTKFVGVLLLAFQILFIPRWEAIVVAANLLLVATLLSPINLPSLFGTMLRVMWFVAFIVIINTFTASGTVIITLWGFYGTAQGLYEGLLLSSRVVLLLVASLVFARTTHVADLMDAFENVPAFVRKVFGPALVTAGLTLNFVPLLIQSAQTIKRAQLARGASVDGGFFRQIRFALSAALPLFVAAFRSSHHLAEAMEARGYHPSIERTAFRIVSMTRTDWVIVLVLVLQLMVVLLIDSGV